MNLLFRFLPFLRHRPHLSGAQQQRIRALPVPVNAHDCLLERARFVVLDQETTGLNLRHDQVISIGAVVIEQQAIDFGQLFEATLRPKKLDISESILIHGITPGELAAGQPPAEALLEFMEFVGDSPLLAYHAPFDQQMLARALREHLGLRLNLPFLDVAEMAPMLCPDARLLKTGLDNWVQYFRLQVSQRHHASADALVTAEIALILLHLARQQGISSLASMEQRLQLWRRAQQPQHSL